MLVGLIVSITLNIILIAACNSRVGNQDLETKIIKLEHELELSRNKYDRLESKLEGYREIISLKRSRHTVFYDH